MCISNILLDALSYGLIRGAKSLTEIMPFKFEYKRHNIEYWKYLSTKFEFSVQPFWQLYCNWGQTK